MSATPVSGTVAKPILVTKSVQPEDLGAVAELHDRITDAYYGKMGDEFMRKTHERIHWVCANVKGSKILDVGCSQGIGPILLAREGKRVVGIDSDPQAIEVALSHLASEPAHVQAQLTLLNDSFLTHDFSGERFDTVVMSEVLEHLVNPQDFVSAAAALLDERGRFIVTVPFGINDFIDHKRTYYLSDVYALVAEEFECTDVRIFGQWIGLVGSKRKKGLKGKGALSFDKELVQRAEAAFFLIERELRNNLSDVRRRLDEANRKYRAATEQIATFRQKTVEDENGKQLAAARVDQLAADAKAAGQQVVELRSKLLTETEGRVGVEKQLIRSEATLDTLRGQLETANQKYRAATEQVAALKQKTVDEERAREASAKQLAQLQAELERTSLALQSESSRAQAELAALRQELRAESEARQGAEKHLIRSEAVLATVRSQLEDANQKYRAATEQFAAIKKKSADEEAARQADKAVTLAQLASARAEMESQAQARQAVEKNLVALQLESSRAQADLAALRQECRAESEARHGAEKHLVRTEAVLATVRSQLEDANQNYQAATEQFAAFEKKSADEDAARQADKAVTLAQLASARAEMESQAQARQAAEKSLVALQARHDALSAQLGAANKKYRTATEEVGGLKQKIGDDEGVRRAFDHQLSQVEAQLAEANSKYRASTAQYDKLKRSFDEASEKASKQHWELGRLQQARLAAEAQVVRTRATLSFQLGYILLHGFKSFRAVALLPGQLVSLRRNAKRRKQGAKKTFVPPAQLAASPVTQAPAPAPISIRGDARHQESVAAPTAPATQRVPATLDFSTDDSAKALKSLRVACIMDEFTFSSFSAECNLVQLSVAEWQKEVEEFKPELLFIESAWRGKDEQWGSKVGHASGELLGIVDWCRKHNVPTVFWNKEDPVHFETFLTTAKQFDHVFTTDMDCIHRYKAALGHERVYLLPFACQPATSNPIEKYQRKDAFCFAGAYYLKYPERTRDLGNFMNALAAYRPIEIYDRNFGKNDPNYQFPAEYQPYIVGNLPFDQIDQAYKGYRYAINLNSIKQSQSMFARRVFELLASNTVTVSNFSRAVRLLFGDLVITSDDGGEVVRRIERLAGDEVSSRKFRLAGLRKVMMNHTYQDRFAYVVSKARGREVSSLLPQILVTAYATNQQQMDAVLAAFNRQLYQHSRLVVVVACGVETGELIQGVQVLREDAIDGMSVGALSDGAELVAGMVPEDYYGPNYLLDLALTTRYSDALVIGKVAHYFWSESGGLQLESAGCQYTRARSIPARAALVRTAVVAGSALRDWMNGFDTRQLEAIEVLAIDEFNYCRNGGDATFDERQSAAVNDLLGLDCGLGAEELMARAERVRPAEASADDAPVWNGEKLAGYFKPPPNKGYALSVAGAAWEVSSSLPDGKHEYLYAAKDLRPADLDFGEEACFHLDVSPGLNLQLVMLFLDSQKQRINHVVRGANRNETAAIPVGTEWVRLGLRIYGSGAARINALVLGHRPLRPAEVLGAAEHLVLTNHYPSYDDLYRNAFVHSRVAGYAARGVKVDVFRLRRDEALSYHEFHDVDVITGSQDALQKLLAGTRYRSVLVHFLDDSMWQVLKHHIHRLKVFVWVHGAEIQPWHRRDYNNESESQREAAKAKSEERMRFWRGLLQEIPGNMQFIFVSNYFAEEVMNDVGIRLPRDKYQIIHNPIDASLFSYKAKSAEQRRKILSIRPYASRTYANDLSVRAIQSLADQPWFKELEFRMIGDGKLFNETLEPLRKYSNVVIERGFLKQAEIAQLHRDYGIFLCPSRMDTQGVSRDEAMASGLVPVTNAVGAIPEFVDKDSGIAVPQEDWQGLADAIRRLYEDEAEFKRLSAAASRRVRQQSSAELVLEQEILLFHGSSPSGR